MTSPVPVRSGLRASSRAIRYRRTPQRETPLAVTPTLVPIVFQQSDTVVDAPLGSACSGLVLGAQRINVQLSEHGIPGSTARAFNVTTSAVRAHAFLRTVEGDPGKATWDAGQWVVRVRIFGELSGGAQIRRCYVCRTSRFGTSLATVASVLGLAINCTAGVKTITLSGVETTGDATDRVSVVLGMRSTLGTVTVRVLPDQLVDSPILRAV